MKSNTIKMALAFTLVFLAFFAQAQNANLFEGKVFKIDNYIEEKFDNSEDLTFTKSHVEGSICVQYGFNKAVYTTKKNKDGTCEFSCIMLSKEHGKMVWNGTTTGVVITGSYRWTKKGQDSIDYTFKGKLK